MPFLYDMCVTSHRDRIVPNVFIPMIVMLWKIEQTNNRLLVNKIDRYLVNLVIFDGTWTEIRVQNDKIYANFAVNSSFFFLKRR